MKRGARAVAVLLLGIAFAVGALTGMALEEALGIDWFEFLDEDSREGDDRLLAGLGLSDEQEDRVEEIMDRQEDQLEAYWERRLPEIEGITRESYDGIRAVLTLKQRAVFDRRVEKLGTGVPESARD